LTALVAAISGVYGLVIGSFLNVVIWRVPRKESVVKPASHCPSCDTAISPRDNLPVISWLALRGRCRSYNERISFRYPFIELVTAGLYAVVGARFSHSWALPAYLVLTGGLIALSVIDLETYLLPNRIVYPVGIAGGVLLVFAALVMGDWSALGRAAEGAVAAFAFFYVVHFISPGGMGFGDVRLSFVLGMFLGWLGWAYVFFGLFAGFVYGAVVGIGVLAVEGARGRKRQIPFGPFLALGTMTLIFFGGPIVDWYHGLHG